MSRAEFPLYLRSMKPGTAGQHATSNPTLNANKSSFKRDYQSKTAIGSHKNPYPNSYINQHDNQQFDLNPILNTGQTFPEDLLLLLTQQASNIKNFKTKIQKEKLKVLNDMEIFKKQIIHIIEDLKISMMAELDLSYKTYIQKYAYLKSEVQEVRMLKKQIEAQNIQPDIRKYNTNSSNSDMVKEIEKEVLNLRNYKISQYINEIQRKKLSPLMQLSQELIIMTSSPFEFYDAATTSARLGELRANFSHFTQHMFTSLKTFIRTPDTLFNQKDFIDNGDSREEIYVQDQSRSGLDSSDSYQKEPIHTVVSARNKQEQYRPAPQHRNFTKQTVLHSKPLGVSQNLQNVKFKSIEQVRFSHQKDIQTNNKTELLCAVVIRDKYIVIGGRDGLLNVVTLSGKNVKTLSGHKSAVCTLSLINDKGRSILASGGDYGCSTILLWDTRSWEAIGRLQHHSAAVTSILDIGDSQTLVSGSYDKKVNVYNYQTCSFQFHLPNNKSSVFGLLLNSNKTKLIVGTIDTTTNGVSVWSIKYSQNRTVQTFTLDRFIDNYSIVCSMASSMLRQDLVVVGGKNGRVKLWNIGSGECEGEFSVGSALIVDLVLVERVNKPNYPLVVSCGIREISLMLTNTENGEVEEIDVDATVHVEFGCGIGPKMVFGMKESVLNLYVVNQSKDNPQVSAYSLEL